MLDAISMECHGMLWIASPLKLFPQLHNAGVVSGAGSSGTLHRMAGPPACQLGSNSATLGLQPSRGACFRPTGREFREASDAEPDHAGNPDARSRLPVARGSIMVQPRPRAALLDATSGRTHLLLVPYRPYWFAGSKFLRRKP